RLFTCDTRNGNFVMKNDAVVVHCESNSSLGKREVCQARQQTKRCHFLSTLSSVYPLPH
ncbi:hypothetical protein J6590_041038, partial [Homalodisca vitripennis]